MASGKPESGTGKRARYHSALWTLTLFVGVAIGFALLATTFYRSQLGFGGAPELAKDILPWLADLGVPVFTTMIFINTAERLAAGRRRTVLIAIGWFVFVFLTVWWTLLRPMLNRAPYWLWG